METDKNVVSSCCGMPVYANLDICSDCKEHCIDDIVTQQYDKVLKKALGERMGAEYEGTLPIENIQLLRRTHIRKTRKGSNKKN